jgi:very-short-patch-repair endonuclease
MTGEGYERLAPSGEVNCRICKPREGSESSLEREVAKVLDRDFSDLLVVAEARAIEEFEGRVDFVCPEEKVLINVDGKIHFEESGYPYGTFEQQQRGDRRCNKLCIQQRWHILRLHHRDLHHAPRYIAEILSIARASRNMSGGNVTNQMATGTVIFSYSYTRDRLQVEDI